MLRVVRDCVVSLAFEQFVCACSKHTRCFQITENVPRKLLQFAVIISSYYRRSGNKVLVGC